jgi:hypothetical protein
VTAEAPAASAGGESAGRSRPASSPTWILLATLAALVLVGSLELGASPWPFRPPAVQPAGPLAPLVDAAGGVWDPAILRSGATIAGLLIALAAAGTLIARRLPPLAAVALTVAVALLLLMPGVLLQAGLRQATAPWFHVNDSTYQIELAGELLREGVNPYGADYRSSGLERFYTFDGSVDPEIRDQEVALRHLAYFPGTPVTAAVWGLLPKPFGDYRLLVALAGLAAIAAALLFRGPLELRLAAGAVVAANPLAVRAAWFGTADAPAVLLTVLAAGLLSRSRFAAAAAALGGAVLLKQFALVAVPFLAAAMVVLGARRRDLLRAGGAFAGVVAAGFLPFAVADLGALLADTVEYGGATYRIVGYGLAPLLLEAGVLDGRFGYYPFLPLVVVVWLPVTALLVRAQLRSGAPWAGPAGFAVSTFLLFFIARVFMQSYLVWPLAGAAVACLLAAAGTAYLPDGARARPPGPRPRPAP